MRNTLIFKKIGWNVYIGQQYEIEYQPTKHLVKLIFESISWNSHVDLKLCFCGLIVNSGLSEFSFQ